MRGPSRVFKSELDAHALACVPNKRDKSEQMEYIEETQAVTYDSESNASEEVLPPLTRVYTPAPMTRQNASCSMFGSSEAIEEWQERNKSNGGTDKIIESWDEQAVVESGKEKEVIESWEESCKEQAVIESWDEQAVVESCKEKPVIENWEEKPVVESCKEKPVIESCKEKPVIESWEYHDEVEPTTNAASGTAELSPVRSMCSDRTAASSPAHWIRGEAMAPPSPVRSMHSDRTAPSSPVFSTRAAVTAPSSPVLSTASADEKEEEKAVRTPTPPRITPLARQDTRAEKKKDKEEETKLGFVTPARSVSTTLLGFSIDDDNMEEEKPEEQEEEEEKPEEQEEEEQEEEAQVNAKRFKRKQIYRTPPPRPSTPSDEEEEYLPNSSMKVMGYDRSGSTKFAIYAAGSPLSEDSYIDPALRKRKAAAEPKTQHFRELQTGSLYRYVENERPVGLFLPTSGQHELHIMPAKLKLFDKKAFIEEEYYTRVTKPASFVFDADKKADVVNHRKQSSFFNQFVTTWHPDNLESAVRAMYKQDTRRRR